MVVDATSIGKQLARGMTEIKYSPCLMLGG